MKKCILFFFFSVFVTILFSQQTRFQRVYGGAGNDDCYAIPTYDSCYILIGNKDFGTPGQEVFLMKVDSVGDTLWTKKISTPTPGAYCNVSYITTTSDSGFLFKVGVNDATPEVIFVKTDKYGDTLWTRAGAGGRPYPALDGGYLLFAGNAISKRDANLNLQWFYHYGGPLDYVPSRGKPTQDSGSISLGTTRSYTLSGNPNDADWYLVKTDSLGIIQWTKVFSVVGDTMEGVGAVIQTADLGYLLVGTTTLVPSWDILVIKTDALGNIQWTTRIGGPSGDWGMDAVSAFGGTGYVITGYTFGMDGFVHAAMRTFVMKIGLTGTFQWGHMYGPGPTDPNDNLAYQLSKVSDGGYLLSGNTGSWGSGLKDAWLIKTDQNGLSGCNDTIVTLANMVPPTILVGSANFSQPYPVTPQLKPIIISSGSLIPTILCTTDSTWLGLNEMEIENGFSIYPNPSNGIVTLKIKEKGEVTIYNLLGEAIGKWKLEKEETKIDLSHQSAGIYFVRVQTDKGISAQKIIIQ